MTEEEESEFELVMPFVICKSAGGPHDDAAFVSGYRLGALDAALKVGAVFTELEPPVVSAPPNEEKQIDLLAMKHGYKVHVREYNEDWSIYMFERPSGEQM
jgi:hypothetical protein